LSASRALRREAKRAAAKAERTGTAFVHRQEHFSGPIPPPTLLAHYDQITPGLASRIVAMAEAQSQHRQAIESQVIAGDVRRSYLGLVFGLLIGLAGLITGGIVAVCDQPWAGVGLGGATLGTLVGAFIYGSQAKRNEAANKAPARPAQQQQHPS
jgi:uncharacterized membrane protein